jgi:PPOX class probable F420-dependent enzyme
MEIMSLPSAVEFLASGTRIGQLATASLAGTPHVAPVWFLVDDDELVFTTARDTVKGRNLRANARAALSVDSEEFPYSFVVVRGPVQVRQHAPDLLQWTTRVAERYVPAGRADEYGRRNAVEEEMLCRLRLERVLGQTGVAL